MEKLRTPKMKVVHFMEPQDADADDNANAGDKGIGLLSVPKRSDFMVSKVSPSPSGSDGEGSPMRGAENASIQKHYEGSDLSISSPSVNSNNDQIDGMIVANALIVASHGDIKSKHSSHRDVIMRALPNTLKKKNLSSTSFDNPLEKGNVALSGMNKLKSMIRSQTNGSQPRQAGDANQDILVNRMNENFLDENFMENELEYLYKTWNHIKRSSLVNFTGYRKELSAKKVKLSDFTKKEKKWKSVLEKKPVKRIMNDACLEYEYSPDYCFNSIVDVMNSFQLIKSIGDFINDGIAKDGKEIKHKYSARLFKYPRDSLHSKHEFPKGVANTQNLIQTEHDLPKDEYIHSFQRMAPSAGAFGRKAPLMKDEHTQYMNTDAQLLPDRHDTTYDIYSSQKSRHQIATTAELLSKKRYLPLINKKHLSKKKKIEQIKVKIESEQKDLQSLFKPIEQITEYRGRRMGRRKALYEQTNVDAILDKFLNDFVEVDKSVIKVAEHDEVELLYEGIRANEAKNMLISDMNWSGEQVLSSETYPEYLTKKVVGALNTQDILIWMKSIGGLRKLLNKKLRMFVTGYYFEGFMMVCTLVNVFVLLAEGFVEPNIKNVISYINFSITFVYQVELILKLWVFGIKLYARSFVNVMEALVAIIATVEIALFSSNLSIENNLSFLSAFRVVRLTRFLSKLRFMSVITAVIYQTFEQYTYVALILLLFVFIFSLIGMQIFGGQLEYTDRLPRQNFDSIGSSFLLLFQLLTMENWTDIVEILYASKVSKSVTLIYFFVWIIIGNFVMFNLFLALLLSGFDKTDIMASVKEKKDEYRQVQEDIMQKYQEIARQNDEILWKLEKQERNIQDILQEEDGRNSLKDENRYVTEFDQDRNRDRAVYFPVRNTIDDESSLEQIFDDSLRCHLLPVKNKVAIDNFDLLYDGISSDISIGLFTKNNIFRRFCAVVVVHPAFKIGIMTVIVISTLKLILETYLDVEVDNKVLTNVFEYVEVIFWCIFALEAVFKIIRCGLLNEKCSYLRDPWCWLEFLIVIGSSLEFVFSDPRFYFTRVFKHLSRCSGCLELCASY